MKHMFISLKSLYQKYKHGLVFLYFIIYLPWFYYLESRRHLRFHVIHMAIDDYIPFCEYFIIPYLLWFLYVSLVVLFFFFCNKQEFFKLCAFLFTGMTIFLIVSTIFPNIQYLRPQTFARHNFFVMLVQWLYQADTPTNLFPSIHVYNSLGIHLAVINSEEFKSNKKVRTLSFILMTSIILSTMFLKQHSVFDVITAFVLAAVVHSFIFARNAQKQEMYQKQQVRNIS